MPCDSSPLHTSRGWCWVSLGLPGGAAVRIGVLSWSQIGNLHNEFATFRDSIPSLFRACQWTMVACEPFVEVWSHLTVHQSNMPIKHVTFFFFCPKYLLVYELGSITHSPAKGENLQRWRKLWWNPPFISFIQLLLFSLDMFHSYPHQVNHVKQQVQTYRQMFRPVISSFCTTQKYSPLGFFF